MVANLEKQTQKAIESVKYTFELKKVNIFRVSRLQSVAQALRRCIFSNIQRAPDIS